MNTTHPNRISTLRSLLVGCAVLLSAALVPLTAAAWMGGGGGPDPDRAVARLTDRLDLTEDQQSQVRAILEEGATERDTLREETRTRMEAHREAMHARLATVLSEDQMEELDHMREARRDRRGECRGDRRGGDCDGPRGGCRGSR